MVLEATGIFDLYYLFVENVFGSVLLTGVSFVIMFIIWGIVTRMNPQTIIMLVGFFAGVFSIGYAGELPAVILFVISFFYFVRGLNKFFAGG